MVSSLRSVFVLVASITTVKAARTTSKVAEGVATVGSTVTKLSAESSGEICGSMNIPKLLELNDNYEQRAVQWKKIDAIAADFLKGEAKSIAQLKSALEQLEKDIQAKKANEAFADLADNEIRSHIETALAAPGRFGSLENAITSRCGNMRRGELKKLNLLVKTGACASSQKAFETAINTRMSRKDARTTGTAVRKVCIDLLQVGLGDTSLRSYCPEMCSSLAASASKASQLNTPVSAGTPSDELVASAAVKRRLLENALTRHSKCTKARSELGEFSSQLEPMETAIVQAFHKVQSANEAIDEAEESLEETEAQIGDQVQVAQEKVKAFQDSTETVKAAKEDVGKLAAAGLLVKTKVKSIEGQFTKAKKALSEAAAADRAAHSLKALVSNVMRAMDRFFDEIVREPLKNMGLDPTLEDFVGMAFDQTEETLAMKASFKSSMQALTDFCATSASHLATVQNAIPDVGKLCDFGGVERAVSKTDAAVKTAVKGVSALLTKATNWCHPFWGQAGMNEELEDQFVEAGEPKGLRQIIGSYGVMDYFMKWKHDGPFLALMLELKPVINAVETQSQELEVQLKDLRVHVRDVADRRDQAISALKRARLDQGVAESDKNAAEELLASLEAESQNMEDNLDRLESAADEANRVYRSAQRDLENAFEIGTGGIAA